MKLAFKVDVDTLEGTSVGVENLSRLFIKHNVPATFLFSLGKDQMGRSIFRIFEKGFLKKCLRSNVAGNYSLKTLLRGTILPSPIIAEKCSYAMKAVSSCGFECGVHCLNHYKWQNFLDKMSTEEIENEFNRACELFEKVFEFSAISCGSAGWQVANDYFRLQDNLKFLYASDTRGYAPFYPRLNGEVFKTLQIPTTLFTLDELLVSNKLSDISQIQVSSIKNADVSVMTIHAELEGMAYLQWFEEFLLLLKRENIEFFGLKDFALSLQNTKTNIKVCDVEMCQFFNRSGLIAIQK